ncbi:TPA: hypothetical protein ACH3X1_010643 [Trebouxia sp. C0004]
MKLPVRPAQAMVSKRSRALLTALTIVMAGALPAQAFPHRSLVASNIATIESASNVTAAITTNVTTGSTNRVTVVDTNAVAMTTNASVAELVAPNTTINGLVTAALLDEAAYVAAPVPVVSSTILNISANNASASVLANISTLQTTLQTSSSSPTLDQVTSSNDLPSSDSRVLVQFNSLAATPSSSVLPSDVAAMDMVINSTFLTNVDTHVLTLDNTTANVSDVVTALRARDDVAYASLDYKVKAHYADTPYGYSLYNLDLVQAPCDWNQETVGTSNVAVCIIDSGIQVNHPDLASNVWVNTAEIPNNGIDDDGNGCVDDVLGGCGFINGQQVSVNDDNSHGTHVAGTIGATRNGAGVLGVAQKVSLMSCKFLDAAGDGYNSDAIACINYCAANFKRMGQTVPIYSNSWGCLNCYDPTVYNAIANTAGLFLFAAGNNGQLTDSSDITQQFFPADYGLANQLSVGASDTNDALASFSNYGARTVSLFAPGVNILSTIPNSTYAYKSGTSMATPHTAGAAALIAAQYPSLSVTNMKASMLASVTPVAGLNGYCQANGRLNIYNQSLVLSKSPYYAVPASGLTKDSSVTRQSTCKASAAFG